MLTKAASLRQNINPESFPELFQEYRSTPPLKISQSLSQKIQQQRSLFFQLIAKTKSRIQNCENKQYDLIQKLIATQAQILITLLRKNLQHLIKMYQQLKQIENDRYSTLIADDPQDSSQPQSLQSNGCLLFESTHSNKSNFSKTKSTTNKKLINVFIMVDVISMQNRFLKELETILFKIYYSHKEKKLQYKINSFAKRITVLNSKFASINLVFPYAIQMPQNDIFYWPKDHNRWNRLNSLYVKRITFGMSDQVCRSFASYIDYMSFFMFIAFKYMKRTDKLRFLQKQQMFDQSWCSILDAFINSSISKQQIKTIYSLQNQRLPKALWDITSHQNFKKMISPTLPQISQSTCLYIPKTQRKYIVLSILDEYQIYPYVPFKKRPFDIQKVLVPQPYQTHAAVRVNCNYEFFHNQNKSQSQTIIVHIHGGGFISMNSYIHQFYIRRWAKMFNIPIFSIDYGKAPQYPFPNALADCLQVYLWLLQNAAKLYGAKKINIILMGDSSGGNLACGVLNFLINNDIPLPSGLILFYPALRVQLFYTPSLLQGIDDMILPHSVLSKIHDAYLSDFSDQKNIYINPIYVESNILKDYPQTYFFSGSKDPLVDDSYRMVQKINSVKKATAFLTVFNDFPHGFLHFDTDHIANRFTRKAFEHIQETIKHIIIEIQGNK